MSKYFGQMWGVRLALWLLAIGLSVGAWQWSAERHVRLHFSARQRLGLDRVARLGVCPVLLSDQNEGLHAWDWRQDKRWRIPNVPTDRAVLPIIANGVTDRILFVDKTYTLVSVNILNPATVERCALPEDVWQASPVGVSADGRFVAIFGQVAANYQFRVIEFSTGKVTDSVDSPEELRTTNRGGEFEIHYLGFRKDEQRNLLLKPIDPATLTNCVRWKVTDEGLFAPSTLAATISFAELDSGRNQNPRSLDGRYTVTMLSAERIEFQERDCETIFSVDGTSNQSALFSNDDRYLFVEGAYGEHRVVDLESKGVIADDHFVERRSRFLNGLLAVDGALAILCLVLALRTDGFEVAGFYYVLAVAFADGASFAINANGLTVPLFADYGASLAIGLFWVWGRQPFLVRLIWGLVAHVALFAGSLSMHLSSIIDQGFAPDTYLADRLFGMAIELPFFSCTSAVAAWLVYQLLGWQVGDDDSRESGRRHQFGLGTLFLATLIAAVSFASWRQYAHLAASGSPELSLPPVINGAAWVGWYFVFNGLFAWLFAGLCFRSWSLRATLIVGALVARILIAFPILFVAFLSPNAPEAPWEEYAIFASILPLLIATSVFPLWLARRHGYRWVRAQAADQPVMHAALPVPA